MRISKAVGRGTVVFPEFKAERVYMREFRKACGLPPDLERWQPTVDAMLGGINTDGPLYLMVDQGRVLPGKTHRRGGVHIEGYWCPSIGCHGGGGSHSPTEPKHVPKPGWHPGRTASWNDSDYSEPEGTILASNVAACRYWRGEWDGPIGDGGDCSAVDVRSLDSDIMEPHRVYAGNVTMLHESVPIQHECDRTLVRITVPGWTP